MADGFLGRWSQRKQAVREGKTLEEPIAQPAAPVASAPAAPAAVAVAPVEDAPPLPTLEDVKRLTAESDFKPFVARDVAPDVRNAAMKKLFADPHYNVMDGLDIYIDDYSKPDPLPESMLRQMASAKFLKLFEEECDEAGTDPLTDNNSQALGTDHDHIDLRLQPNHAAGPRDPGRGTE